MDRVTCRYIKRDGSICGGICTRTTGCSRHWKLYEKNMKKRPCLVCEFPTDADSGYCAKYCSKYSAKFHALNYRMRQKYIAETFQSGIPLNCLPRGEQIILLELGTSIKKYEGFSGIII